MNPKRFRPNKFYRDDVFIDSPEARPVRILAEYLGPRHRLWEQKVRDTIVFFGSARIKSKSEISKKIKQHQNSKGKKDALLFERYKHELIMSRYYEDAVRLAYKLTAWSKSLMNNSSQRYLICSGGGPGIMEAANKGAKQAKGRSVGFNISLPHEPNANPYISKDLNMEFHYFFMRKYWFAYLAKALVVFPGGFGTLDELFELMTLVQTQKMTKPIPILIYGSLYWKKVLNFDEMVKWGTIAKKDLNLFHFSDDVDEAFDFLKTKLTKLYR